MWYTIVLLAFCGGLILIFRYSLGRIPKRWWYRLEYFYVGVYALVLITASGHIRQLIAQNTLSMDESRYTGDVQMVKWDGRSYEAICRMYAEIGQKDSANTDMNPYQQTLPWFVRMNEFINGDTNNCNWKAVLNAPPLDNLDEPILKDMADRLINNCKRAEQSYTALQKKRRDAQPGILDHIMTIGYPLALAFAFALNVTCITARRKKWVD